MENFSQEEMAVVKLAAAQRYKELNVNPETAEYLFQRHLQKSAKCSKKSGKKKPAKKATKKAQTSINAALYKKTNKAAPAAAKDKKPAVKALKPKPTSKEAGADRMSKITKLAAALKPVVEQARKKAKA